MKAEHLLLLFPIVGAVLFLAGIVQRQRLKNRLNGTVRTTGEVVDNIERFGGNFENGGVHYYPLIEFTVAGRRYRIISSVGTASRSLTRTRFTIFYDPSDPSKCDVEDDYLAGPRFCIGLGLFFFLLGGLIAYLLV